MSEFDEAVVHVLETQGGTNVASVDSAEALHGGGVSERDNEGFNTNL